MKRQHTHGFSLIEMAVAMAVIGILMAAVMPNVSEWMQNSKVRTGAESLQAGLQTARNEAVKSNRTVTFWLVSLNDNKTMDNSCKLSDSSGSWVVSITSPEDSCGSAPSKNVAPMLVMAHPMGEGSDGVTVVAKTTDGRSAKSLTFNGFGQVVGADGIGTLDVSSPSATRSLRIVTTTGGSTFVCDPHISDTKDPRHCPG